MIRHGRGLREQLGGLEAKLPVDITESPVQSNQRWRRLLIRPSKAASNKRNFSQAEEFKAVLNFDIHLPLTRLLFLSSGSLIKLKSPRMSHAPLILA